MRELTLHEQVSVWILAGKLAKDSLELFGTSSAGLMRLQFRQIVASLKELDDHIQKFDKEDVL